MNRDQATAKWFPTLFAGIVFIAIVVFAIIYREPLIEVVLVPILYILWLGNLIFKSFDQRCIWLLALVITLLVSLSLSRSKQKQPKANLKLPQRRDLAVGRIRFWQGQIRVGSSSVYARTYRRSELRQLTFKVLAYQDNCSIEEVRTRLRSGQLQVPAEVRYVLGLEIPDDDPTHAQNRIERIQQTFERFLERFFTSEFIPDPRLVKVAEYLESKMEIDP